MNKELIQNYVSKIETLILEKAKLIEKKEGLTGNAAASKAAEIDGKVLEIDKAVMTFAKQIHRQGATAGRVSAASEIMEVVERIREEV